ncbi:hypothetical protein KSP40_PGU014697 [Platanthera guangdongensis]|uniref:Uncharacterized protein n=1 Tax=Platanthera guangdongensis TaxID=2320717 RepID=A0ABR2MVS2_9ASPA
MPASDHGNNHRLIVRLPNPGRSPARTTSGGSLEDPSASSRASSPGIPDKHEHGEGKVTGRDNSGRTYTPADLNGESWQSNDVKAGLVVCDEGDRSSTIIPNEEGRPADETMRAVDISRTACSSSGNDKIADVTENKTRNSFSSMNALIESCAKYSEATTPLSGGDDIGMNLLASVAAGEMSKSDIVSPASSPGGGSPATEDHPHHPCNGTNEAKARLSTCDSGCRNTVQVNESSDFDNEKHGKGNVSVFAKDEVQEVSLKDKTQQNVLLPDLKEEIHIKDDHQNQDEKRIIVQAVNVLPDCKSEVRSPKDQLKNSCSAPEMIAEETKFASDSIRKNPSHGVDSEDTAPCRNLDKMVSADLRHLSEEDAHVGGASKEQKPHSVPETGTGEENGLHGPASSVIDKLPYPESTDGADGSTLPNTVSISSPHGKETISRQTSPEKYNACSSCHDKLPPVHSETEASVKMPSADGERKEEVLLAAEISPFLSAAEQDGVAKLDFDLNEGIIGDDMNQSEPISAAMPVYSPRNRISSFSSLSSSPILSGSPAHVTIAAPAKGPFTPPENLLKSKGELGWKGSAATSAFRPAEPRKVLEMPLNTSDVQSSDSTTTKQGRPPLEIDLNVADDTSIEDAVSQNSTQTTGSESGVISNHDAPGRATGGLDLDLNRVDESAENGQLFFAAGHRFEAPLLPSKPATKRFANGEVNMLRDFDLNNGPGIDDLGTDLLPRSQNVKSSNSMPFVPPITGFRMSNADLGSGWFPPGNSYPAITIPSFLPDRGEQSYPMAAAAGAQRILGTVTGSGSFGGDVCRGQVLPSSPALAFSPAGTAYSYAGFPFGSGFPLASTSFSPGSTTYVDSSSGVSYFPPIASPLAGAGAPVPTPYGRPYMISLPEGGTAGGSDGGRRWGRSGLDLNAGPGNAEEAKEDRAPSTRQLHAASSQGFMEDQARLYQVAGSVLKRKEPDAGWEPERFTFKQPSWQIWEFVESKNCFLTKLYTVDHNCLLVFASRTLWSCSGPVGIVDVILVNVEKPCSLGKNFQNFHDLVLFLCSAHARALPEGGMGIGGASIEKISALSFRSRLYFRIFALFDLLGEQNVEFESAGKADLIVRKIGVASFGFSAPAEGTTNASWSSRLCCLVGGLCAPFVVLPNEAMGIFLLLENSLMLLFCLTVILKCLVNLGA